MSITKLKKQIEYNLEHFSRIESRSYIQSAIFHPNQEKLYAVFKKHSINTDDLANLHHRCKIVFYQKGFYEIQKCPLQKVLNMVKQVIFE